MNNKIPEHKLNDAWKSGYCQIAIEQMASTEDTFAGSLQRQVFMESHVSECGRCYLANVLKTIEYAVAVRLGDDTKLAFMLGKDVSKAPGFKEELLSELRKAPASLLEFVKDTATARAGTTYKGSTA